MPLLTTTDISYAATKI